MEAHKWYEMKGEQGDVVISTRVRLARNLARYPFPGHMNKTQEREVLSTVSRALTESAGGNLFKLKSFDEISPIKAAALVERHLISPEMASSDEQRGVVLSPDEKVSVMINEEDHIRIQVLGAGLCLDECMEEAGRIDDLIDGRVACAFDERLGYLTHCPTNLGTGLRASVMLHLPALTETGRIRNLISAANKLGFAVRGLYGEGTAATGSMYQISNQRTLGISEGETVARLKETVKNILEEERGLRLHIKEQTGFFMQDRVWRAAGILSTARLLKSEEAMPLLSDLRMGISMGEIKGIEIDELNRLLWEIQPACLSEKEGRPLNENERDKLRAEIVRRVVKPAVLT